MSVSDRHRLRPPHPRPGPGPVGLQRRARARPRGAGLMAAPPPGQGTVSAAEGVVTGAPRRWLLLEGLVVLAGALTAFGALGQPWWLVPAAILAPDIAMTGYLAGPRPGAHLYNLTHATPSPAVMLAAGYRQADRLLMALALIWLAHIGLDRLLGTGLKCRSEEHT